MPALPPVILELAGSLLSLKQPEEKASRGIPAAVLILLFPRDGEIVFLLTKRPDTLSRHPGQISLPGGRAEPGDEDLWRTAVREAEEELGISRDGILPLGRLEDHQLRVSGYVITPFAGWCATAPRIRADPAEVAEVIEVPLNSLLDEQAIEIEMWGLRGTQYHVTFYRFGEYQVWGATARMLHDLARRLGAVVTAEELRPGSVRPVE